KLDLLVLLAAQLFGQFAQVDLCATRSGRPNPDRYGCASHHGRSESLHSLHALHCQSVFALCRSDNSVKCGGDDLDLIPLKPWAQPTDAEERMLLQLRLHHLEERCFAGTPRTRDANE